MVSYTALYCLIHPLHWKIFSARPFVSAAFWGNAIFYGFFLALGPTVAKPVKKNRTMAE